MEGSIELHAGPVPKNRFRDAYRNPDFTIEQDWASYSAAEHDRWDRLFRRSLAVLQDRACDEFLAMTKALALSDSRIPDMEKLSRGSCLCGGVKFEIAGLLTPPSNCHCSMCRKTARR